MNMSWEGIGGTDCNWLSYVLIKKETKLLADVFKTRRYHTSQIHVGSELLTKGAGYIG